MRNFIIITTLALGLVFADHASAQQAINPSNPTGGSLGFVAGFGNHGVFFPGYYRNGFGGTAASAYLRCAGAYYRGLGQYNLNTVRAMTKLQQARRLAIQNRQYGLQNYYENKQMNKDYRESVRKPVPSRDRIERMNAWAHTEPFMANTVQQDGSIAWPRSLLGDQFAQERAKLEAQFQGNRLDSAQVKFLTDQMLDELRADIREIPASEFVTAKKFLGGLKHEAKFAPANGENLVNR